MDSYYKSPSINNKTFWRNSISLDWINSEKSIWKLSLGLSKQEPYPKKSTFRLLKYNAFIVLLYGTDRCHICKTAIIIQG